MTTSEMSLTPSAGMMLRLTSHPASRMTTPIWATASKTVMKLLNNVLMLENRGGWGGSLGLARAVESGLLSAVIFSHRVESNFLRFALSWTGDEACISCCG